MPELILFNGKITTQDSNIPNASAIAIRDGKVLAVGEDDEILALPSAHTRQIDLQGRRVLPGLTDAHFHLYEWALLQRGLDLDQTTSLEEVLEMVREAAHQKPAGEWIVGQGWNQDKWGLERLPTRQDLDAVAPDHPVILWRTDMHMAWANTAALKAASITAEMDNPPMGVIDRDEHGAPSGTLRELAINLVRDVLPPAAEAEVDAAIEKAIRQLHSLGLTGVHDFRIMGGEGGRVALRAFQRLHASNRLALRTLVLIPGERLDEAIALGLQTGFGDDILRLGPAKYFADGSTGARTSWMIAPFEDGGSGMPLTPMETLADAISKAHQAGIGTAIHAIGDRAIRELLDVYAEVIDNQERIGNQENTVKPRIPHRIEHVQHSQPEDLKRLGALGLVASVQPVHATDDYQMIDKACGSRGKWAYAFRNLLDAGTVLAFGSDCPVASPNPFWGIHAAVTRQRRDGSPAGGWYPEQRLTVAEAVWGYTMGGAIASGQQDQLGSLSPGKLADLVVLDRDIFAINPIEIYQTQVEITVFGGRIVFQSNAGNDFIAGESA